MKYISKDRSFQTGEISNFNELFGISLILPENHYYKLELCKDVNKRSRQLDKEYEFPIKPVKTRRLGCSKMFYQKFEPEHIEETGHIILIEKGLKKIDPIAYIETLGHEHGHLMERIGLKNKIYDLLKAGDLGYCEEDFAWLCGLLALHRKSFDINSPVVNIYSERIDEEKDNIRLKLIDILKSAA